MASLLDKTNDLAEQRGWNQYVLYMLMIRYLRDGDLLEEFHEYALDAAQFEKSVGY
jgi:hypothetical protein